MVTSLQVGSHPITVRGRMIRVARLRDEFYDFVDDPSGFVGALKAQRTGAHVFTFLQEVPDPTPRYSYHREFEDIAVLRLSTYDHWWKKQINDKTRNMVRKAYKCGLEVRAVPFSDSLVEGIARIHNETPFRQGRRFKHYGKPLATVKADHASFLDRSEFFGAYYNGELVGFIKLVHGKGVSNLMQIIAMLSYRDKAPTNALLAKAVERCAEREVPLLQYGVWSRRSMGEFKKRHAFEQVQLPRYFVPLNALGALALRCGLHRGLAERIPAPLLDRLASARGAWNGLRWREQKSFGAVAQLAERRS